MKRNAGLGRTAMTELSPFTGLTEVSDVPEVKTAGQPLMRMKVKHDRVEMQLARLISKSFALKFLRKAFINARIQVIKNPSEVVKKGYELDARPADHEVWQVWSGQNPLVEVVAPRDILPFVCVREAFRCKLKMNVSIVPLTEKDKVKGVRLVAEPIPETKPTIAETIAAARPPEGIDS